MALPPIVTEAMQTSIDSNRAATEQAKAFSEQVARFSSGIGELGAASMALNQFAKREKKIKNPFTALKEGFDKTAFGQARIQKREEEALAKKIGISREELLLLKAQKDLTDSQEAVAESFRANAAEYGINLENISTSFNDVGEMLLTNDKKEAAELKDLLGQGNLDFINEMRDLKDPELNEEEQLLLEQIAETIRTSGQASDEQMEKLIASDGQSSTYLQNMAREMASGELTAIENAREAGRRDDERVGIFEDIRDNLTSLELSLIDGFSDLADVAAERSGRGIGMTLGLIAAPFAFAVGALKGLSESLKLIAKTAKGFLKLTIVKPLKALGNMFVRIGNALNPKGMEKAASAVSRFSTQTVTLFNRLATPFKNAAAAFKAGLNGLKVFRKTTGQFGKLGVFGQIGKTLGTVIGFFKNIGSKIKGAFSGVGRIGTFFSSIDETFKPIVKTAAKLGRVVGRLFYPITLLMAAFDGIKGFFKGFSVNGIVGGISGAFFGIVDGLVMKVLDLIKGLFSWIFDKIGFDSISEALDSFSFSELWTSLGDKIQEAISWVRNFFGNLVDGGIKAIKGFFGFGGDDEEEEKTDVDPKEKDTTREDKAIENALTPEEKERARQEILAMMPPQNTGAEVDARSRESFSLPPINVIAPQTSNINNNSQSMNQTISIPATPNPNSSTLKRRKRINSDW